MPAQIPTDVYELKRQRREFSRNQEIETQRKALEATAPQRRAAEEAAQKAAAENAKALIALRKQLLSAPSEDWSSTVPKYPEGKYDTPEKIQQAITDAWMTFVGETVFHPEISETMLRLFLKANDSSLCDLTEPDTFFSAYNFLLRTLYPESIPEPQPQPAATEPDTEVVEKNPCLPGSREWREWDYRQLCKNLATAGMPASFAETFRAAIAEICESTGLAMENGNMEKIGQFVINNGVFTRQAVRNAVFQVPSWAMEVFRRAPDSMTSDEQFRFVRPLLMMTRR